MSYAPRSDSWAGQLSEDEQCLIFERWLRSGDKWEEIVDWLMSEFEGKVAHQPSRSSLYEWRDRFRPIYNQHESEKVRHAGILVAEYARANNVTDEQYIAALKAIGSKAMVANDAQTMARCIQSAMEIKDRLQKAEDLALKDKAQRTKEADLALAREKFEAAEKRLNAATKAITDETLTDADRISKIKSIFGLT